MSFVARLATFPVTAVATLLSASLLIGYGGPADYGAVMLVATLFQFLPFADLGLGAVVVNSVSRAEVDQDEKERTVAAVIHWLALSSLAVVALSICGITAFSWSTVLGAPAELPGLDQATALALAVFAVSLPFAVGQRILVGLGKNPIAILISTLSSVITVLVTLTLIWLSAPVALITTATPLGVLASSVVGFEYGRRALGLRWKVIFHRTDIAARSLFRTGAPMLVVMVGLPIAMQSGRLFLAHLDSATALSEYTLAMQLYSPIWSFISVASAALWPLFAAKAGDRSASRALFARSALIFGCIGVIGAIGLAVLGPWISEVLSSGTLTMSSALALAVAALMLAQTLQQVPGMFLTTPLGLTFQAGCVVALAIFVLVASPIVTPLLGAVGPPLTLSAGVFVCQLVPGILFATRQLKSVG